MFDETLQILMLRGWNEVERSSTHHLPFGFRRKIWRQFGPARTNENDIGWRRRVKLSFLCADRVAPIWTDVFPMDHKVEESMRYARLYYNNATISTDEAIQYYHKCDDYFSSFYDGSAEESAAGDAGMCVAKLISNIAVDDLYDAYPDDDYLMDTKIKSG